jgi:hypothetical protein
MYTVTEFCLYINSWDSSFVFFFSFFGVGEGWGFFPDFSQLHLAFTVAFRGKSID